MLPKRRLKICSVRSCWLCSCCDGLMTLHENMAAAHDAVKHAAEAASHCQLKSQLLISANEQFPPFRCGDDDGHTSDDLHRKAEELSGRSSNSCVCCVFIYLLIHSFIWTSACSAVEFWVYFLLNIEVAQWWFVKGGFNPSVLCVVSAKVTLTAAINNKPNFN